MARDLFNRGVSKYDALKQIKGLAEGKDMSKKQLKEDVNTQNIDNEIIHPSKIDSFDMELTYVLLIFEHEQGTELTDALRVEKRGESISIHNAFAEAMSGKTVREAKEYLHSKLDKYAITDVMRNLVDDYIDYITSAEVYNEYERKLYDEMRKEGLGDVEKDYVIAKWRKIRGINIDRYKELIASVKDIIVTSLPVPDGYERFIGFNAPSQPLGVGAEVITKYGKHYWVTDVGKSGYTYVWGSPNKEDTKTGRGDSIYTKHIVFVKPHDYDYDESLKEGKDVNNFYTLSKEPVDIDTEGDEYGVSRIASIPFTLTDEGREKVKAIGWSTLYADKRKGTPIKDDDIEKTNVVVIENDKDGEGGADVYIDINDYLDLIPIGDSDDFLIANNDIKYDEIEKMLDKYFAIKTDDVSRPSKDDLPPRPAWLGDDDGFEEPLDEAVDNAKLSVKVKDWYTEEFDDDELGEEIDPDLTFADLDKALTDKKDVYDVLGVADSIIRERCFAELSDILDVDYDDIYYRWLATDDDEDGLVDKVVNAIKAKPNNGITESIEISQDIVDKLYDFADTTGGGFDMGVCYGEPFWVFDNYKTIDEVADILEPGHTEDSEIVIGKYVDDWGFSDEWFYDDYLNEFRPFYSSGYRTAFAIINGAAYAEESIKDSEELAREYIDSLVNNPSHANLFLEPADLRKFGFEKVSEGTYANGLYDQHDDPKKIFAEVKEQHPNGDVLFNVVSINPYETEFDVWVRDEEKVIENIKLKESIVLTEGTSNFWTQPDLQLYAWLDYDSELERIDAQAVEAYDGDVWDENYDDFREEFEEKQIDDLYSKGYCLLSDYDYQELEGAIDEANQELSALGYDFGERAFNAESGDNADMDEAQTLYQASDFLFDIKITTKAGYYEGGQLYIKNWDTWVKDNLIGSDEAKQAVIDIYNKIGSDFGLMKLGIAYQASNGETGYNIVK